MTTALLASALFGLQNPAAPHVALPQGWKVEYWAKTRSGVGGIVGPQGQEIAFPDYFPTGKVAVVTAEMDRKALFVTAVLKGREVDVAVATDGLLAVSLGTHGPGDAGAPFDFWRRVNGAREVAETLAIVLTRIEATGSEPLGVAPRPSGSEGNPFPGLQSRRPLYEYRTDASGTKVGARFESRSAPRVDLREGFPDGARRWTVRERVLGGTLTVAEGEKGWLAASYELEGGPTKASRGVLVAAQDTPQAGVQAILAAIAYRP